MNSGNAEPTGSDPVCRRRDEEVAFKVRLAAYVERLNEAAARHWEVEGYKLEPPKFSIDPKGRKYIRIIRESGPSASVHVFVVKVADSTYPAGTILKADGYKGPTRNFSRGNIFDLPKMPEGAREDLILHLGT